MFKKKSIAVIMAAGSATRWGNYLDVPKQLIKIDNEAIIKRTIRLLKRHGVRNIYVTVPSIGYFGKLGFGVKQIVGRSDMDSYRVLNAEPIFKDPTLFFYGDVFYTKEAMKNIICSQENYDYVFYGRSGKSDFTGKTWGEMFAFKANAKVLDAVKDLNKREAELKRCLAWEIYRTLQEIPLEQHVIKDKFIEINDFTEDFDYPKDYDVFIEKYNKANSKRTRFTKIIERYFIFALPFVEKISLGIIS